MSLEKLSQALKLPIKDPMAKLILLYIADHYNDSTQQAWPSIDRLVELSGASRATVIRKLKLLTDMGIVTKTQRYNKTNMYQIHLSNSITVTPQDDFNSITVTPLGVSQCDPNSYRTLNNNNKGKIKICEWQPTDDDVQFCKDNGHDPDNIIQMIRLWDEKNGNKAAYIKPSAFYRQWVLNQRKPHPSQQKPTANSVVSKSDLTRQQWDEASEALRAHWRKTRPINQWSQFDGERS